MTKWLAGMLCSLALAAVAEAQPLTFPHGYIVSTVDTIPFGAARTQLWQCQPSVPSPWSGPFACGSLAVVDSTASGWQHRLITATAWNGGQTFFALSKYTPSGARYLSVWSPTTGWSDWLVVN